MLKDIIIIGAGGVGRETALIIESINEHKEEWNLLGFVDDDENIQGKLINGYNVLGKLEYLLNYNKKVYVVCAIANCKVKKAMVNHLQENKNIKFATLIHPSVNINKTVEIGQGSIIYNGVILTANIKIGNQVIISPKCGIGHDSVIEDYVTLLWNVNVSGSVKIGQGSTLGSGSTIIQGLEIGKNSFIGAGAAVIRDRRK